jgi:hypothetical protein
MGLYKLCEHRRRARDRCEHAWWGSFQHKGRLHRASLSRSANQNLRTKAQAQAALDRMRDAVRAGRFEEVPTNDLAFEAFADLYLERCVKLRGLRSGKEIEQRLAVLKTRWQGKELAVIRVGEIEDLIHDLKAKGRRPATINRWLALLRHMFNWALGREHVTQTPFSARHAGADQVRTGRQSAGPTCHSRRRSAAARGGQLARPHAHHRGSRNGHPAWRAAESSVRRHRLGATAHSRAGGGRQKQERTCCADWDDAPAHASGMAPLGTKQRAYA